jgi:hypothetical protein
MAQLQTHFGPLLDRLRRTKTPKIADLLSEILILVLRNRKQKYLPLDNNFDEVI